MNVEIRDALPDLLNGKLGEAERALLQDHVDGCADCRVELALLRDVKSAAAIAPVMDVNAIASAVPRYAAVIQPAPARKSPFARTWKFAAAAAVLTVGVFTISRESPSRQALPALTESAAVVSASPPAMVSAAPAPGGTEPVAAPASRAEKQVAALSVVGLQDLSDSDIEELLADLGGMDGMPSAEPQSVTTVLDDAGLEQ